MTLDKSGSFGFFVSGALAADPAELQSAQPIRSVSRILAGMVILLLAFSAQKFNKRAFIFS